jgi:hypothetical protein
MARFFGKIGYANAIENPTNSGIWVEDIVELSYYGDVIRNSSKNESGEYLNNNIIVGNSISVVADQYAINNFSLIRYIFWSGSAWSITGVEVRAPRLILDLGDVYTGPFPAGGV